MAERLPENDFVRAILAHPHWALVAGLVYVFCAFVLWQFEMPQWIAVVIFASLVLAFTVVGSSIACTS